MKKLFYLLVISIMALGLSLTSCQILESFTHTCESVCATCEKCTDEACTESACAEKCKGHTPAHECESECPTCEKCTDETCAEAVCAEKCEGHVPPHACESECPTCEKCTDETCTEAVCAEKCEGHVPPHECESECPTCGDCKDAECEEEVCASKCDCPVVLYSQDFAQQPTDGLKDYVNVENGVATVTADDTLFFAPATEWLETNAYEIMFDLAFSGTNEQLFIHLPGLNATEPNVNVYFAIQGDGYMCLNCWYQGNWRLVYNFNAFFGGANASPLVWGTDMHAFRIVIINDAIELWIDNVKYISTNMSAFGGLTNGNPANASANIPAGPLTGLGFHPTAANVFKMDNLVIKEAKAGTDPVVLVDDTAAPGLPIADVNNSALNFTSDNYKVEATFDVISAAAANTNICLTLIGANGVTGCIDAAGATSINVQLNVNGDGTATPVLYHYTVASNWVGVNGTAITLPTEGTLTMKFVSCGDNIFWYINDVLVLSTTYTANGMTANNICSLGLFEIPGALEYATYTYTALTAEEIEQYSKVA